MLVLKALILAEKIAKEYGVPLGKVKTTKFSDGEFQPAFEESVRGRRVFIIGSTFPTADNLMEMLLMLDAAKRASARHITAVMPYFGWARQDRKDQPRVAIGAKLSSKLITSCWSNKNNDYGFTCRSDSRLFSKNQWIIYMHLQFSCLTLITLN